MKIYSMEYLMILIRYHKSSRFFQKMGSRFFQKMGSKLKIFDLGQLYKLIYSGTSYFDAYYFVHTDWFFILPY